MGYIPPHPDFFMEVEDAELTKQINKLGTNSKRNRTIKFLFVELPAIFLIILFIWRMV